MIWWEAIVLGIVQGLTEFLPVSSSGHIELAKSIFGLEIQEGLLITVVLHLGTALSTIVVFRKDIISLLQGFFKWEKQSVHFTLLIALSMIPAAIVGIGFEDELEALFSSNITFVSGMLVLTGLILFISERVPVRQQELNRTKALGIGIAQAIAILPGISRSGSTIAVGLLLGIKKEEVARFSFLMVLPLIIGATLLKAIKLDAAEMAAMDMPVVGLAFLSSFFFGILACSWMLRIVKRKKLIWFALYCAIVGIIGLVFG